VLKFRLQVGAKIELQNLRLLENVASKLRKSSPTTRHGEQALGRLSRYLTLLSRTRENQFYLSVARNAAARKVRGHREEVGNLSESIFSIGRGSILSSKNPATLDCRPFMCTSERKNFPLCRGGRLPSDSHEGRLEVFAEDRTSVRRCRARSRICSGARG
jgi:hypothetical protein